MLADDNQRQRIMSDIAYIYIYMKAAYDERILCRVIDLDEYHHHY